MNYNFTKIKAVIFDFDGTLVDTMGAFADLAAEIISKKYGMDLPAAKEKYILTSGNPFIAQLEIIFPGDDGNKSAAEEFEARKKAIEAATSLKDDVIETLKHLKDKGFLLIISTSNFAENVKTRLTSETLPLFGAIMGFDEKTRQGKPHFAEVTRDFNLATGELLFVGDSLQDAKWAYEADVMFIGRNGTFKREDFNNQFEGIMTIEQISELKNIL